MKIPNWLQELYFALEKSCPNISRMHYVVLKLKYLICVRTDGFMKIKVKKTDPS